MRSKLDILQLTDYVLFNSCSMDTSGFYNGKAGLSLCLFEVARLYNEDYLEEQAFELLQEVLLSKTEKIDFEHGLSGIGFVLAYLIDNGFVDQTMKSFSESRLNEYLPVCTNFRTKTGMFCLSFPH